MNYSYVMGVNDIDELKNNGFDVQKLYEDEYGVSFTDDKINYFEEYILKHLKPGFWNEYLGKNIVFIFRFEDGSIKKYILNESNHDEILGHCRKFANCEFESINKMLKDTEFYAKNFYKI